MASKDSVWKVELNNDAIGFVLAVLAILAVIGYIIFSVNKAGAGDREVKIVREKTKVEHIKACKSIKGETDRRLCIEQVG